MSQLNLSGRVWSDPGGPGTRKRKAVQNRGYPSRGLSLGPGSLLLLPSAPDSILSLSAGGILSAWGEAGSFATPRFSHAPRSGHVA